MNSTLPLLISAVELRKLAAPDETHAVRLVMLSTGSGNTPYTLRGMKRRYVFTRDHKLQRHILDIPASIWMQNAPTGAAYRDNTSIPHDLQSHPNPLTAFVTHIVPWGIAVDDMPTERQADFLTPLRDYLAELGAPDAVNDAFDIIRGGGTPDDIRKLTAALLDDLLVEDPPEQGAESILDVLEPPVLSESPAAVRMREGRAKKRAEREAKKLQPS